MAQLVVDVSEHNGQINWEEVKNGGYHAIIRAGFGRFDAGGRYDYQLDYNVSECERLGIPYGFYWYSYATRTESAVIEAEQLLDYVKSHDCHPQYPLYFDTEEPGTQSVSKANAIAFGDKIEEAGYWCGVYASQAWWFENLADLDRFTKWVAKWSDQAPTVSNCDLWQYRAGDAGLGAFRGSVPGIGWSDINIVLRETLLDEIRANGATVNEVEICPTCGQPITQEAIEEAKVQEVVLPDVEPEEVPVQEPVENVLTYNQRAAEVMKHMCSHDGNDGHGYSQYQRWGDGTSEKVELSDGTVVAVGNGDYDCSSAVISAWEAVLPGSTGNATYTGNMKEEFLKTGLWEWHVMGDGYIAQAGDIYLNEVHHTAMCLSAEPDIMAQFSISERNTISGQQGDQTGWESNIKPYANYGYGGWDGKLVYVGEQPAKVFVVEDENGELDVDGYWGKDTTAALQKYFGTEADGEVWHQWSPNVGANEALVSGWICDNTAKGSPVIRALQNYLGITSDGILGSGTVSALQERMGTPVDGFLGAESPCVKELQRRLNSNNL